MSNQETKKSQMSLSRIGGLVLIASLIGGFAVGFNIISIGIFIVGIILIIVGLATKKK
ncbi:MAG TPA: hypothetical protein PKW18_09125 [Candidatus Sumerlaeota bacterium]|jgi:membrane-bound ClpP family serine protease|nr:MAG: hypothetical protein BWY12_00520 [candidate division BRC1 bacterium ADurb.Bin183]HOE63130.1 hypothetical protein [Candidatus Sumerlaeota bacterium]HRR31137.1 hypothetical protein [Candidatus Sumerlaeia bacterium]HON51555.1 hypothetical protein [Candidatus Sumerlaeota bacterium]HOR65281.1 hypothetical protein [Candidatus Sumerlaeota bacterium]